MHPLLILLIHALLFCGFRAITSTPNPGWGTVFAAVALLAVWGWVIVRLQPN